MDYGYSYGYEYGFNQPAGYGSDSTLAVVMTIYLIVLTAVVIFSLVSYIFHSVGMYNIGKRMGKERAWLAFIPFARDYYHGNLAGEIPLKNRKIKNPGIWYLILPIIFNAVLGVIMGILIVGAVIGVIAVEGTGNTGLAAGSLMGILVLYAVLLVLTLVYSAVYMALRILINKQIFANFTTGNMAVVHAVLSAAVPLYEAICFFVMRKKDFLPGKEPHIEQPPVPPVPPIPPVSSVPPVPPVSSENPEGQAQDAAQQTADKTE